jgi:SAM-dependent methyltransferase
VVYDRRCVTVPTDHAANLDFWACDVAALPFADGTFALATALNLIDCVQSPRDVLAELSRTLRPDGRAILTTPYDWSPVATPIESWLGGHSQRSVNRGASEPVLRALLTPGGHPAALGTLTVESERAEVPWHVRLHERSTVAYKLHLIVAKKLAASSG